MPGTSAPIEAKVVTASWTAIATGLLTWGLVTFVPAFHSGLPPALANFLPLVIATASSTAAGYFTKHTPRADEVMKAAFQILSNPELITEVEALLHPLEAAKPVDTQSAG